MVKFTINRGAGQRQNKGPKKTIAKQRRRRARVNPTQAVVVTQSRRAGGYQGPNASRQMGAAVITRFPRLGFSDILRHKMAWILGYTFVGDGTNGTADNVFFQTAAGTYLMGSNGTAGLRGAVPILGGDTQLGATYVLDVEKHYARKIIQRMTLHVVSLQPSTANNMMAVVAIGRGSGLAELAIATPLATANNLQQTFTNVMSMDGALTVDSFESKSIDITRFIAGGFGARQNEFEIANTVATQTVLVSGSTPAQDLLAMAPATLTVSGNNTTAALRNTKVHAIVIEQEIDFLDFIGGNVPAAIAG